jgi:hypothetical protein
MVSLFTENFGMSKELQTIKKQDGCRMCTLLLVKYRDEPSAKMCIQCPFVPTVNENNIRLPHILIMESTWTFSVHKLYL